MKNFLLKISIVLVIFILLIIQAMSASWFINDRQISIAVDGDTTIISAFSPSKLLKIVLGSQSIVFDSTNNAIAINADSIDLNGSVTEAGEILCYGGMAFTDSTELINLWTFAMRFSCECKMLPCRHGIYSYYCKYNMVKLVGN